MFALFFAMSELHTNCAPAQTAGTARESTQSAALQETHTEDVTRNFGRASSCNAVRMTFGALGRTFFSVKKTVAIIIPGHLLSETREF